jgi:hypothetical protein
MFGGSHARQSPGQILLTAFHKAGLKTAGTRARAKRVRGGLIAPVCGSHKSAAAGSISRVLPEHGGGTKSEMAGPIKSGRPGPNIEVPGNIAARKRQAGERGPSLPPRLNPPTLSLSCPAQPRAKRAISRPPDPALEGGMPIGVSPAGGTGGFTPAAKGVAFRRVQTVSSKGGLPGPGKSPWLLSLRGPGAVSLLRRHVGDYCGESSHGGRLCHRPAEIERTPRSCPPSWRQGSWLTPQTR